MSLKYDDITGLKSHLCADLLTINPLDPKARGLINSGGTTNKFCTTIDPPVSQLFTIWNCGETGSNYFEPKKFQNFAESQVLYVSSTNNSDNANMIFEFIVDSTGEGVTGYATLNGNTQVPIVDGDGQPILIYDISRGSVFDKKNKNANGYIYISEQGNTTAGKPNDLSKVHLFIDNGGLVKKGQSEIGTLMIPRGKVGFISNTHSSIKRASTGPSFFDTAVDATVYLVAESIDPVTGETYINNYKGSVELFSDGSSAFLLKLDSLIVPEMTRLYIKAQVFYNNVADGAGLSASFDIDILDKIDV